MIGRRIGTGALAALIALAQVSYASAQNSAPAAGQIQLAPAPAQRAIPDSTLAPSSGGATTSDDRAAYWGAIGFTADGSFSTAWKASSKAEAEAEVAKKCAKFGRGSCEVVGFPGNLCAALATYIGAHSGRRYKLSFTGGGATSPDAQRAALDRCNGDKRTRNRCQMRTVVCGDGR